jgi:RNA polymerase sigma-70 factor (ECF subfamily)
LHAQNGDRVTEPDDQRLVRDLRVGQPEACAAFVRAHYQAVYRFLVHLTRDVHEAEDLTQETFAAAWKKLSAFEGRASLATWLHRIAYTKFIDAQRAEARASALRERLPAAEGVSADPFDDAMADEETQRLHKALHCLGKSERALLVLHYLQGLSYREMAAVLDEPTGTVKWRTAEALSRLRASLTDEVADYAPGKSSHF